MNMHLTIEEACALARQLTGQQAEAQDEEILAGVADRLTDFLADLAAWHDDNRAEGD